MNDTLQAALHATALGSPALTALAVFCANVLLFGLVALLAALLLLRLKSLTPALLARMAVSLLVSTLLTLLLGHLIADPRPYLAEHYAPLAHVAVDNGFPSDHTLIVALLLGWAWWLDRRWWPVFAAGLLAVLLGRLAIGAHHSLAVLGSVGIASAGLLIAAQIPWPTTWPTRLPFVNRS
ncbi:phosphatase PAP2 family protein [Deinococcus frigens]|uniref:phosphatase PAP2 family protein n=1 Tax=Deinococcus frigens TaxID=249403 RepID=UPI0004950A92|nr:phosphatase PAP2 family protein [Deinococcus frigens]